MITVIEQTTSERQEETRQLFETIRPYLDEGYGYMSALHQIGRVQKGRSSGYYRMAWFKDLVKHGEQEGYDYDTYSGKKRK